MIVWKNDSDTIIAEPVVEQAKEDWVFWLKQEVEDGTHT